ncbi:putative zinc-binding oxidoreductase ToxD [Immersiella caudata]|uniref:Zinc-binding oxidoreductase ToxD n=1 Tax=Immersiella caudata TaxID=314043 RepID=A0AA39WPC9_9PEZI|nr:putative zinc-binding oxidoreductase ToxD [Immersiella caudata]
MHVDFLAATFGGTAGCDFAGVIEAVGSKVQTAWKKGDRVAGMSRGAHSVQHEYGAFGEYCLAKEHALAKLCSLFPNQRQPSHQMWHFTIPDTMSFEEVSKFGVSVATIRAGLFQGQPLPLPLSGKQANVPFLVYGASTATGTLAVQYARLVGCTPVVATSSPVSFDLLKSLGADHVLDYNDPEVADKMKALTNNSLTAAISPESMGPKGGVVTYLLHTKHAREDVVNRYILAYTGLGDEFTIGPWYFPAKPEDKQYTAAFWHLTKKLLAREEIRPHPADVHEGGLEGIFDELQLLREKRVSGKKLVYTIDKA